MKNNKFGNHKHYGKELNSAISWLNSLSDVQRIILTLTKDTHHLLTPGFIHYWREALGGILIKAYDNKGIAIFYIKTNNKEMLIRKIEERFK